VTFMLIAIIAGSPSVERHHLTFEECHGIAKRLRAPTAEDPKSRAVRAKYICIAEGRS